MELYYFKVQPYLCNRQGNDSLKSLHEYKNETQGSCLPEKGVKGAWRTVGMTLAR